MLGRASIASFGLCLLPVITPAASIRPALQAVDGCSYGYQWWLCPTASGVDVVEGAGRGGQELLLVPTQNLILVATGGDYSNPDAWEAPWRILEEGVLPALQ